MHMTADFLSAPMLEAATDWLLRLQAEPGNAALQDAHRDWLAADIAHEEAWRAVQRTWSVTGQMKPAAGEAAVLPFAAPKSRRRVGVLAAVAALAACLVLAVLMPTVLLHLQADAVTATAENRALPLADGSTVILGGATALSADVNGMAQRRATLLRGEAHFQIAADRQRPFVITAGLVSITVVGTAFDVTLDPQAVSVAVASGIVEVGINDGRNTTRLTAGERIEIDSRSGAVVQGRLSPDDVGAWRERRLVVHDLPLAEAISRLGRYYRGEILSLVDGLESQRVSGVFDLDDPSRALRGMLSASGPALRTATVRQITPYLIVLNK